MQVAFINSKGFGGNNATAVVLSADKTNAMLARRYESTFSEYLTRRERTRQCANDYAEQADRGSLNVIYRFGENLIDEKSVSVLQIRVLISQDLVVRSNLILRVLGRICSEALEPSDDI